MFNNDHLAAIIAEVRALAFDQFTEAVSVAAVHHERVTASAQHEAFDGITRGAVSRGAITTLLRADPERYRSGAEVHKVPTLMAEEPATVGRAEHAA